MALNQEETVRTLLNARTRIAAAAWLVTRDAHTAEDIFQNVSIKALAGGTSFNGETKLISWAHISARHEALNWIRARTPRAKMRIADKTDLR